ncbi:cupin domain-containing protein [Lutibacter citreus]|uniref:cupin domain-containing protein n=1 Tax=Lutibacter citreus TaxID=2138210 RepID=UPI000DBE832E|nr:cupin domain-containing protein [Lutibacter citreus]
MSAKYTFLILTVILLSAAACTKQIPIEHLNMNLQPNKLEYTKTVLENEIPGVKVEQISITGNAIKEHLDTNNRFIYLFIKGSGTVTVNKENYDIVPETILVPNSMLNLSIKASEKDTLHFLKIASKLTEQDLLDLKDFPKENIENVYYRKFTDCESYTEPIKSPNTISRTILPNKYIPRIAMGTVQTKGPDKVGAHEHGMLEQLFLGLTDNKVVVFADDAQIKFPEYSILHIPLGSSHSVEVEKDEIMYYVWMDFFRDKKGEEWLKTHNKVDK